MSDRFTQTRAEVTAWFFEDYLPRWVSASSGATDESPEFILDYWGVPMHVSLPDKSTWFLDAKGVLSFLEMNRAPLKAAGYTHTVVPDSRVFVYNIVGAAVEVIWSRRRADDSEIQRWAVHFEVAKSDQGWRVVAFSRPQRTRTHCPKSGRARQAGSPYMPEPVYPPLEMPPTVERRKVTIWSNGVALDGDVYRPRQVAPDAELPAVVLCHGWGGSKLTGERYAALFADAGMITLTFTQATWFGSGARVHLIGPPPERDALGQAAAKVRLIRDQVDPVDWIQNFHAAIDFIEGEPNVDPGRIGAWGTSFGGGVAIHAAANDARIKVLSVQVTAVVPLSDRALARARQRAIEIARGAIDPIPEGLDARPGLAGSPNLAKSARYNVLGELDRLHIPTNMIDAGDEEMFAIAENCGRAFEQLRGRPGQIVNYQVIPGIKHYGIYFEGYDASSRSALAWFERHL